MLVEVLTKMLFPNTNNFFLIILLIKLIVNKSSFKISRNL